MRLSLRAGLTLAAGSLALHELRFLAGYGGDGTVGGHAYLAWLVPLVALTLAAGCGVWLARIGRGAAVGRPGLTWLGASASLAAVYVVQETIEALGSAGHPGPLAHGGWVAAPLALLIGAIVAAALRGAHAADRAAAAAARPWTPLTRALVAPDSFALPAAAPPAPRPRVIARRLAGRAPPRAS